MLREFIGRENTIFEILSRLKKEGITFILIGGYAVSAFKHRFSVDADIVIKEKELNYTTRILEKDNFKPSKSLDLENIYNGKFKSFIKKSDLPVSIDLLINSVSCRQTNASWSFELFNDNSVEKEIRGIEKSVIAKIPVKELLIATKLHSCRLTDIRDIVALCNQIDTGKVITFAKRGESGSLTENISRFRNITNNKDFIDAFKGVFSLEKFSSDNLRIAQRMIDRLEKEMHKGAKERLL